MRRIIPFRSEQLVRTMSSRISSNATIPRLVFPPDFFVYDFVFMPYVFGYDVYFSRIFFGYDSYFFGSTSYFFGYDLVLLPYFFGYDVYFCRISSDTTIYDSYFFGYDAYFFRISLDRTILRLAFLRIRPRITLVFLRIRQFYDSYFFGYDNSTTSYFFRYDLVFPPYLFGYDNSSTRIYTLYSSYGNSTTCIPPYSCCNSPVLLCFRNPKARISSEEYEHAFGFRILGSLFCLVW